MEDFCSATVLNRLLKGKSISDKMPWSSNDEVDIDRFYKTICENLCREMSLSSQIEWNHYGSGYASFIDAWFYRETDEFRRPSAPGENEYTGLVILFSRLSPYFVAGEESKRWCKDARSSYLPAFGMVDDFTSRAVTDLLQELEPSLVRHGLIRLHEDDLSLELPPDWRVPTILDDPPYRAFDALFHWED